MLTSLKEIKGIIFDVDGTILDSNWVWNNIGIDYLKNLDIEPEDNLNDKLKTMGFQESASYFKIKYGIKASTCTIIRQWNNMVRDRYLNEVSIKDGLFECLEYFSKKGIRICCCSETSQEILTEVLIKKGIMPYLEFFISCIESNCSKTSSNIYDLCTERFSLKKEEVLVIEDAPYAIISAIKGGYKTIGIIEDKVNKKNEMIINNSFKAIQSLNELRM